MHKDTKGKIAEQLAELLKTKKLEDITIKQLVDACGISRQTFYYYYEDILSVMEYWVKRVVEQNLADSLAANDLRMVIRSFVARIVQDRSTIRKMIESRYRAECERIFRNGIMTYLRRLFQQKWPNPQLIPSDIHAFLSFHAYGLIGLVLEQCTHGEPDVDQLVDQLCRLFSGEMKAQLDCSKQA